MVLEYTIARILLRTDQADEAARICECLILTYRTAESTRDTTAAAGLMLADYCIGMALKSRNGQDASEAEKYGWLLEAMALSAGVKLPSTSHQGKKVLGLFVVEEQYFTWTGLCAPREVVLKLGDYYQCMGRKDLARDCFRQGLNEAIRLLLDDDPGNDSEAWTLVVYILLAAGDDENAISALLARITILVKESLTEETKQEEVEEVSGGLEDKLGDVAAEIKAEGYAETRSKNGAETKSEDGTGTMSKEGATATAPTSEQDDGDAVLSTVLPVECVGCLEPIRLSDMFICRFCFDTGFCSDCLEKVQDGTHPRKICGSSHEWLLFPKVRKAQLLPPKDGMVQSAGKWVELETWANNLGKNWDLEKLAIKGQ
jgi:hypothetical protein